MLDESFIFYGENGYSNVLDIGGIDIKMVSQKTIFHFLRNGTLVEIDDLVSGLLLQHCEPVDDHLCSVGDCLGFSLRHTTPPLF